MTNILTLKGNLAKHAWLEASIVSLTTMETDQEVESLENDVRGDAVK